MKQKFKKTFFLVLLILFFLALLAYFVLSNKKTTEVEIRGIKFETEVVSSEEALRKGLSRRKSLCQKCAMLFEENKKGIYSFWMKDMEFDLDIIWIRDNEIVFMAKNVSHNFQESIRPPVSADKILEINGGLSDKYLFQEGDRVKVKPL